jgi:hypothetical protein
MQGNAGKMYREARASLVAATMALETADDAEAVAGVRKRIHSVELTLKRLERELQQQGAFIRTMQKAR